MSGNAADETKVIVRKLVEYIHKNGLASGDRLPSIRELAALWDVGTNVVRDAVLRTQTLGLVRIYPRSGAFVQALDFSLLVDALAITMETGLLQQDQNLFHMVRTRKVIECVIVEDAARLRTDESLLPLRQALDEMRNCASDWPTFTEADEQFHLGIAAIAGDRVLETILRSLLVLLRPYRSVTHPRPVSMEGSKQMHESLYRAILEGDSEKARSLMDEHLNEQRLRLREMIEAEPEIGPNR